MEYEIAAMQAANRIFPNAQLFGCLFHLTRNIKRHLSTVPGAMQKYNNNPEFALHCRTVIALAFVPLLRMDEALQCLENNLPQGLDFLIDWIEDYYVGKLKGSISQLIKIFSLKLDL